MNGAYLESIVEKQQGITHLYVTFCDVESYSRRATRTQASVVAALTMLLRETVGGLTAAREPLEAATKVEFLSDVIVIPTGDGAAIVFPFLGIPDIHLTFARMLVDAASARVMRAECEDFLKQGWCNCHDCFNLRIGLSEGIGIIYKDVNGRFNAAGRVINLASRVMNTAGRNEIVVTDEGYRELKELLPVGSQISQFSQPIEVVVKGNQRQLVRKLSANNVLPPPIDVCRIDNRFRGSLEVDSDLVLLTGAKIEGEVFVKGKLTIEEGAQFLGNVTSDSLVVAGNLSSGMTDTGRCELKSTAVVCGDIRSTRMLIEPGATFIGKHETKDAPKDAFAFQRTDVASGRKKSSE